MQKRTSNNPYYFQFDSVTHYQLNMDETALEELELNKTPTEEEELLQSVLFKNHPPPTPKTLKNLNEVSFIKKLVQLGFKKEVLKAQHFAAINEIFKEHSKENIEEPFCGLVYRDILVFHKLNKITGIVKLCFSCGHHHIIGTKKNTVNFGQSSTFKKLQQLLNN